VKVLLFTDYRVLEVVIEWTHAVCTRLIGASAGNQLLVTLRVDAHVDAGLSGQGHAAEEETTTGHK
jgi:hypothetical protein